jgi:hypothetical protein
MLKKQIDMQIKSKNTTMISQGHVLGSEKSK